MHNFIYPQNSFIIAIVLNCALSITNSFIPVDTINFVLLQAS